MYLDVDSDKQVNKQRKSWNDIIEVERKKKNFWNQLIHWVYDIPVVMTVFFDKCYQ